ncbi:MAG: hypothetical protein PWP58_882 [Bacillota bacterium]|jgi:hypothetical protein|nr:hypothetical protein [Bacillota bacterium]MDK2882546.1 hypothetical protein [Bacillota bacterium]
MYPPTSLRSRHSRSAAIEAEGHPPHGALRTVIEKNAGERGEARAVFEARRAEFCPRPERAEFVRREVVCAAGGCPSAEQT